jgi:O-antigen/teichoic acid export membrane protein
MSTARAVMKNAAVLLAGRVISIGLGVAYIAVLARYIHAVGMGKIATGTSLVSMLDVVVGFGLSEVIVRDVAADRTKADAYVPNVLLLRLLLSIALGAVILGISTIVGYPSDTRQIIYLYGFTYIFDDFTDVAFSIFNAHERMEYAAFLQTGRDVVNVALTFGAIYLRAGLVATVIASALASLLKLAASLLILRWRFVRSRLRIDPQLCQKLLIVALPFAIQSSVQLVNRQVGTFLLSLYRPAEEVGWFSAANALISYMLLLPTMFMQAIFPVFARFHVASKEAQQLAYRTSFRYLLLVGLPLCAGTIVTAGHVTALLYGQGFENAALAVRILALILGWMFGFANGALMNATGGQTIFAAMSTAGVAMNIVAAMVLIPRLGYIGASISAIVSGGFWFLPETLVCHKRVGIRVPYGLAIKAFVSAVLMASVVASLLRAGVILFAAIAIAPLVYGALLVVLRAVDREDWMMLARLLKRRAGPEHA